MYNSSNVVSLLRVLSYKRGIRERERERERVCGFCNDKVDIQSVYVENLSVNSGGQCTCTGVHCVRRSDSQSVGEPGTSAMSTRYLVGCVRYCAPMWGLGNMPGDGTRFHAATVKFSSISPTPFHIVH